MTQICPCTLYAIIMILGFAIYVIAVVAVYRKNHKTTKPNTTIETTENYEKPRWPSVHNKAAVSSEDPSSAILKEINEKLSNIDAIAKFTKTRLIADKLVESQEKTKTTDPVRAKITKTVKASSAAESAQLSESKSETIAERTKELT
ncbi:MAG: hypothetical protein QXZ70_01070 [Candidatus Bathyarchaeia archaeon]